MWCKKAVVTCVCVLTDGVSVLEETTAVTIRSSSASFLGRMSEKNNEGVLCQQHWINPIAQLWPLCLDSQHYPTLSPRGLSNDLLQFLHLSIYLLIVSLPGINLGGGEEGRVCAHVWAQEMTIRTQTEHHSLQLTGEEKSVSSDNRPQSSSKWHHMRTVGMCCQNPLGKHTLFLPLLTSNKWMHFSNELFVSGVSETKIRLQ